MTTGFIIDAIGWVGVCCLLFGYIRASRVPGTSDRVYFHVLNIIGAVWLTINAYYHEALPMVALNSIWVGLGVLAIARVRKITKTAS